MKKLLSNLTIVEVSAFVAAPYAGLSLAQLGATVIRIDPIGGGLDYNRWPISADSESFYWAGLNKGKKSITINVKEPEAQELAQTLMTAPGDGRGFILTNLRAHGWLNFKTLKKRRKDTIMVNILGTKDGAVAVDYTVNARTGFPMVTGPNNHEGPVNHVIPVWDVVTGLASVNALLVAERHRKDTGKGQYVKIALADCALSTLSHLGYIAEVEINQDNRPKLGNHVYGTFACDFKTKDYRRIMITAFTKSHWIALKKATQSEKVFDNFEIKNKTNLTLEKNRYAYRKSIASLLNPWFENKTLKEASIALDASGACWGPYQTFHQAVKEDPDLTTENPMIEEIEQPGIGRFRAAGSFIDFSGIPRNPVKPAPRLGQHTDEILANYLKLSERQIGRLHDKGLVSGPSADHD